MTVYRTNQYMHTHMTDRTNHTNIMITICMYVCVYIYIYICIHNRPPRGDEPRHLARGVPPRPAVVPEDPGGHRETTMGTSRRAYIIMIIHVIMIIMIRMIMIMVIIITAIITIIIITCSGARGPRGGIERYYCYDSI